MRFTVQIDCDSAAFGDDTWDAARELGRILKRLTNDLSTIGPLMGDCGKLFDINGNAVGGWELDEDAPG